MSPADPHSPDGPPADGDGASPRDHLGPGDGAGATANDSSGSVMASAFPEPDRPGHRPTERELGDFTTSPELLRLVPLGIAIGVVSAGVSLALLIMIGFLTHVLYYQEFNFHLTSPNRNTLGWVSVAIPVVGGIVVGLMARFGSDQIRGHGIPEAMENILIDGSRVQPKLAIIKPIASAIAIGTGGPFGAEGPIILTGGAVASVIAQLFRLTAIQRRSLLVAGASAGMAAVFGTPVAATLFGVELLVFEFKPRSMVLIGLACATADGLRIVMAHAGLVLPQPLFPIPIHAPIDGVALLGAAGIGIVVGLAAWVMTVAVYGAEDLFLKLTGHLHWMWWPAIGGAVVGLGGMLDPRALGVGYNTIHAELLGQLSIGALLLLCAVKLVIWSLALGSGTSGGIIAPLLMMGAALGGVIGHVLPGASPGAWAMIGMAGALAGVTRSPFTSIVFAFELTHDQNSLLALLVVATVAHLVSVLTLKRSILTEKVARRGFHVMREYAVEPFEATFVREVMDTSVLTVSEDQRLDEVYRLLPEGSPQRRQWLYPVLGADRVLVGVLPWSCVIKGAGGSQTVGEVMVSDPVTAHADELLSPVADRMAACEVTALPVVSRSEPLHLDGLLSQFGLLRARQKLLVEERRAERVLMPLHLGGRPTRRVPVSPPVVEDEHSDEPV